jgi:hypothetical protein
MAVTAITVKETQEMVWQWIVVSIAWSRPLGRRIRALDSSVLALYTCRDSVYPLTTGQHRMTLLPRTCQGV